MAETYNPGTFDVLADVTINSVVYIVTDYNDAGPAPVVVPHFKSNGAHRGDRIAAGEHTGSITIQWGTTSETAPEALAATPFTYGGVSWMIAQAGISKSSTSPSTRTLSLRKATAAP